MREAAFTETGRLWLRGALEDAELAAFDAMAKDHASKPGARLAAHPAFGPGAALGRRIAAIWPGMVARRALIFNKTEGQNWGVPWHQDRIIAVADRNETPGFGNWSQKQGHWHCEPPLALLQAMLFVRVHLDDCNDSNGAMMIAVGSHREGLVADAAAKETAARYPHEVCAAKRGDVLVLNMLTLHASRPATHAGSRRTLRVDYSVDALPSPLQWEHA